MGVITAQQKYLLMGRIREAELELAEAVIKLDEGETPVALQCLVEAKDSLDAAVRSLREQASTARSSG